MFEFSAFDAACYKLEKSVLLQEIKTNEEYLCGRRFNDINIHKCIGSIIFIADNSACCINPVCLPAGCLKVPELVLWVENCKLCEGKYKEINEPSLLIAIL